MAFELHSVCCPSFWKVTCTGILLTQSLWIILQTAFTLIYHLIKAMMFEHLEHLFIQPHSNDKTFLIKYYSCMKAGNIGISTWFSQRRRIGKISNCKIKWLGFRKPFQIGILWTQMYFSHLLNYLDGALFCQVLAQWEELATKALLCLLYLLGRKWHYPTPSYQLIKTKNGLISGQLESCIQMKEWGSYTQV